DWRHTHGSPPYGPALKLLRANSQCLRGDWPMPEPLRRSLRCQPQPRADDLECADDFMHRAWRMFRARIDPSRFALQRRAAHARAREPSAADLGFDRLK